MGITGIETHRKRRQQYTMTKIATRLPMLITEGIPTGFQVTASTRTAIISIIEGCPAATTIMTIRPEAAVANRSVTINAFLTAVSLLSLVGSVYLTTIRQNLSGDPHSIAGRKLSACESETLKVLSPEKLDLNFLAYVSDYCYKHELGQDWLTNMEVTSAGYHLQIAENQIMLWMVVIITVSGVFLAGLQLRASYLLASSGRLSGGIGDTGELSIAKDRISLKSSVTGLLILTVSFAFFLVFVLYVYTIKDGEGKDANPRTAPSSSAVMGGASDRGRSSRAPATPEAAPSGNTGPPEGK